MQPHINDPHTGAAILAVIGLVLLGILIVGLVIQVVVCIIVTGCLKRVPPPFRKQEPGMVWLLLIPLFRFIWNFFVHLKVAESYQAYFNSIGKTDVGDCGKGLALAYCICAACTLIPYLGAMTGLASLVLLIIMLVKFNELKNLIPATLS
jgi:hypothetical protein